MSRNRRSSPGARGLTVHVPGPLRRYVAGESEIYVEAGDVRSALCAIEQRYPELYHCVCDETGSVRRHINIYVGTNNIRDTSGTDTTIAPGEVLFIIPAVSGGSKWQAA